MSNLVTILVCLTLVSRVWATEKVVPVASLPKPVLSKVSSKYPEAKIFNAEEEIEAGKTTYEVALSDKGTKLQIVLDAAGEVLAIEKEIPIDSIPKVVLDGLHAKYPKASIAMAEEITKSSKITYEIKINKADEKKTEVTFDDAGRFIEEEAQ